MSFDPKLFAKVGHSIRQQGNLDKEARIRTAIGRAYYALFLSIRTEIRTLEGKAIHGRDDRIDHGALKNLLYLANNSDLNNLARTLDELYEARRQADYVLEPTGRWEKYYESPRNAKRLLIRAEAEIRRLPNIDFTEMVGKI